MWEESKSSRTPVVVGVSFQEVASLLNRGGRDETNTTTTTTVLAGTSGDDRKSQRPLWRFYSARMLTHSHSDGEFPIYSQGKRKRKRETTSLLTYISHILSTTVYQNFSL